MEPRWLRKSAEANEILPFDRYLAIPALKPQFPLPTVKPDPAPEQLASGSKDSPIELSDTEEFDAATMSTYCVQRKSPLICPNQELVAQFAVIKNARWLDGEDISHLSYSRAIAVSRQWPCYLIADHCLEHQRCAILVAISEIPLTSLS